VVSNELLDVIDGQRLFRWESLVRRNHSFVHFFLSTTTVTIVFVVVVVGHHLIEGQQ
jgi:hypothetical protein